MSNEPVAKILNYVAHIPEAIITFIREHLGNISAHTLGWLTIIMLHLSSVPTLLAVLTNQSDKMPPVDMVLFMWAGLLLLFARATILKDGLNIITIGLGFAIQAVLMALMIFK